MSGEATITVNGKPRGWRAGTVRELLRDMEMDTANGGLAVALNAGVVPRGAWDDTRVNPGDKIEIVHIVRGG